MSATNPTQDQDRIINHTGAYNPAWAIVDAQDRSSEAVKNNPAFFNSPQHQAKIEAVQNIIQGFFKTHGKIYINHRENRGQPFTTVKVSRVMFPAVSQARKASDYLNPLRALGVEIVFSARTNSYLYHVR